MSPRARLTLLGQGLVLGALVGVLCGAASALFLWVLERATGFRLAHASIVFALPVAGIALGVLLERVGQPIRGGHDLIIDTVHDDGPALPLRMAPLVLVGTVLTHLFGGSAGREGTAVQMGASLSDGLAHRLRVDGPLRRHLIAAGIAGGFGSVFGTPIAGAVYGLEVLVLLRRDPAALVPALVAAVVGDLTTRALGIEHVPYPTVAHAALTPLLVAKWALFALALALVSASFVGALHALRAHGERLVPRLPARMALGGLAVVGLWQLVGTSAHLGLGVPTLVRAFVDPSLPASVFALKLLFTLVTLGAGFLGGEVTPLFVAGAALGGLLARLLGIPIELGAGVGMAALFAAAADAPIALTIMAVELLGAAALPHVAIVCLLAAGVAGHRGLYRAQRAPRSGRQGAARLP